MLGYRIRYPPSINRTTPIQTTSARSSREILDSEAESNNDDDILHDKNLKIELKSALSLIKIDKKIIAKYKVTRVIKVESLDLNRRLS